MKEVKTVKVTRLRNVIAMLVAAVMVVMTPAAVFAATSQTSTPSTSNQTLRVSPVRSDLSVSAGSSGLVKTYVTNISNQSITVEPIENDFIAGDESGTPAIILNQNSYAPTHSLKRFMVPLSNVTVAPHATQEVDVTIRVPATAQAGGYFGAIRFAPVSPAGDKSVNVTSSVASLILMTVPGALVETLQLTNFDVQQNGGTGSNFRTPNNLSLLVRFKNTGNVQEGPFGQIYVQKGKKVVYTYDFNNKDPKDQVLPDSARRWEVPLKGFGKFGKYTVGATFTYGTNGTSIEITKTIWIIPTKYILVAIGIVILVILLVFGIWRFLRSYKKRILRQSGRDNRRGGGSFGPPAGGSFGSGPRSGNGGPGGAHQASHGGNHQPPQPHAPSYGQPTAPRPANSPTNGSQPPRREGGQPSDFNGPRNRF